MKGMLWGACASGRIPSVFSTRIRREVCLSCVAILMADYSLSEKKHLYGRNFHLLSDPIHELMLAKFCSETAHQPEISRQVRSLSRFLATQAANFLMPRAPKKIQTRMAAFHPREAQVEGNFFSPHSRAIVVDLMRAGILPSQIVFEFLHEFLPPQNIRQDHILLNRSVGENSRVVGINLSGYKVGGSVEDTYVFLPDPMGATGASIERIVGLYEELKLGRPVKFVALHFIVTPEYLKRLKPLAERVEIFALRVDRGLSSAEILKTPLGEKWDLEKGLNDKDYIVPGAGGIGEILNNSFV